MRPIVHLAIGVVLVASLVAPHPARADDPTVPAAEPVPEQAKISKSRSNIQNNREAPPPKDDAATTAGTESAELVKTKTKSNQSND